MAAEYKNCPVCHTINPPDAKTCECGYRFSEGEALTDRDIARRGRSLRLKRSLLTAVFVIVIVALCVVTLEYGIGPLLYVLAAAAIVILVAFILYKVKLLLSGHRTK